MDWFLVIVAQPIMAAFAAKGLDAAIKIIEERGEQRRQRLSLPGVNIESVITDEQESLKNDVTIIIDFGERDMSIEKHVRQYLAAHEIDSSVCICTNPNGYRPLALNDPAEWRDAVKGIKELIAQIANSAPAKVRIFINGPLALAFAIGYASRPIITPDVYQFNNRPTDIDPRNKYRRVFEQLSF